MSLNASMAPVYPRRRWCATIRRIVWTARTRRDAPRPPVSKRALRFHGYIGMSKSSVCSRACSSWIQVNSPHKCNCSKGQKYRNHFYGKKLQYRQVSDIRCTLVGNKIVDHSDVVGASPVGAAPTTSSFSKLKLSQEMKNYCKTYNIRRTLLDNKIVDHSDVVGASPAGAAPTTSSFST